MAFRTLAAGSLLVLALLVAPSGPSRAGTDKDIDLDALGGKVVVLDFWASWCVPCRRSFPWLNSMHEKYGDAGLVIIGVNLDNDPDEARAFLDEFPPRFRIHYDRDKTLARQFDVMAMPSSYVIGRDGQVAGRHLGFKVKKQEEYEAAIAAALAEKGVVH
jgi:thiol-disulfide isomerase/thioredoxin